MNDAPSPTTLALADELLVKTLRQISAVVSGVAAGMAVYLYFYGASRIDAVAPALIVLFALGGWLLLRAGRLQQAVLLVISGVLVAATIATITYGSVRSAGAMLFACVVAGAGTFGSLRATLVTVTASVGLITGLAWAEWQGLLVSRNQPAGPSTVATFAACIVIVALIVYYSRRRNEQALARLQSELDHRQRTERERDRSLERFVRIFRNSPSPMLAQSARDGMILDVNPAFERCYGYTREQVLGRSDLMLWADPRQRTDYLFQLAENRNTDRVAGVSLRADGNPFDVLVSSELSDDPDDRLVITTITDVTRERQYEALLASLASGTVGETGEGLLHRLCEHMATSFGADMTGVAERKPDGQMQTLAVYRDGQRADNYAYTLAGSPCENTLSQSELCVVACDLDQLFPQNRTLVEGGFKAYSGHSLLDADGQSIGLIHALWRHPIELDAPSRALLTIYASRANAELMRMQRDSEIQRLNQTLDLRVRERTAELQKLNAELDAFAYSVSHDLKSPLRAIDGFTQLLQESLGDRLNPFERETLGRVLAATQRMGKLIADLLALARVSQGTLNLSLVDLSAMALQILEAEQRAQGPRRLQWCVAPDLSVQADPRLLRIALENLIGNAVKYTCHQAAPRIEIGRLDEAGPTPRFFIRDNGAGFDMTHANRLFQPFQRLHTPSSGYEGTGIGLATVRRIVERHGGHIQGMGRVGMGAEFRFSLASESLLLPAPTNA